MRWLTPHLVCLGCGGEDETHRACLCHEDPQQVGDAEKSRGTQLNLSIAKSIGVVWKITFLRST